MPLFAYKCECGKLQKKFYRNPKDAPADLSCDCGKIYKKQLSAPASRSIVVVDNGLNARAVEVNLELVEDIKSRSDKDFKEK